MDDFKKSVRALVIAHSEITVNKLVAEYKKFVSTRFPLFGHKSALELFESLPDDFIIVSKNGVQYIRATPKEATKHLEELVENQNRQNWRRDRCSDKKQLPVAVYSIVRDMNAIDIHDDKIAENGWHATKQAGALASVFVSEVHSPYKFWFHTDPEVVDRLTNSLQQFYSERIVEFKIPKEFLKTDLVCVAVFGNRWCRIKIVDVLNPFSVMVFCFDFGTTAEVNNGDLRFLDKKFASLPMQAVRGCLDWIRPTCGLWTWDSTLWFSKSVKGLSFGATITAINRDERTVYVKLKHNRDRTNVGSLLVKENHALTTKKSLHHFTRRHYSEVYPSFHKIETGAYPSLETMNYMKEDGLDYLLYEQSVINYDMLGYQTIE